MLLRGIYQLLVGVVKEVTISDKIPVTWSSHGPLTYVVGGDMFSVKEVRYLKRLPWQLLTRYFMR